MRSQVLDLPQAIVHARRLGEAEGITDVVDYVEGNIQDVDLGGQSCDILFLGNIVHHLTDRELESLLLRAARALRPGGVLAIWDMAPPAEQPELDLVAEGFSLLFYLSSASVCRPPAEYLRRLQDIGFDETAAVRGPSPTHVLITGRWCVSP